MSWLIASARETTTAKTASAPKAKTAKVAPAAESDAMSANVRTNFITIGATTFYNLVPIDVLRKAHKVKCSPDAPPMVKAIFAAPLYAARWEESKAWLECADNFEKDYNEKRDTLAALRNLHARLEQIDAQVISASSPSAKAELCGNALGQQTVKDLATFLATHKDLFTKYDRVRMKDNAEQELDRLHELSILCLRLILQLLTTGCMQTFRATCPDWSGIPTSNTEAFAAEVAVAIQTLESFKSVSDAVVVQLGELSLVKARKQDQDMFNYLTELLSKFFSLRIDHLRNIDNMEPTMAKLSRTYIEVQQLQSSQNCQWVYKAAESPAEAGDSALAPWVQKPLVSTEDAAWLDRFLEANERVRFGKVVHRRMATYDSFFSAVSNDLISEKGANFFNFSSNFSVSNVAESGAWYNSCSIFYKQLRSWSAHLHQSPHLITYSLIRW